MPELQKTYFDKVEDLTAYNGTLEQRLDSLEKLVNSFFTIPNPWQAIYKDVTLPQYKHQGDAGQDIRAYLKIDPALYSWYEKTFGEYWCYIFADSQLLAEKRDELPEVEVLPGECLAIPTGLNLNLPEGFECQIRSRSGHAMKRVVVNNSPGTIDSGYKRDAENLKELLILLYNQTDEPFKITHGDRIAQAVFNRVVTVEQGCTDGFCSMPSASRFSGFGSSGVK